MGQNTKKQTRSLSNLLFHNKARRSKHWQIYCKGRDESVPRCCSWTLKPLLGAELKLILSVLHMNLMCKLMWRVFTKMRMVPASLVFCSWCFISHLLFQSASVAVHMLWTWCCMYQPAEEFWELWTGDVLVTPCFQVTRVKSSEDRGKGGDRIYGLIR